MDSSNCLAWCHEVRDAFPNDRRTAMHALEWLTDSASRAATEQADHDAIEAARRNAARILAA